MTEVIAVPTTMRLTAPIKIVVREADEAAPRSFWRVEIWLVPRSAAGRCERVMRERRLRDVVEGPERFVTELCSHAGQRMQCHLARWRISGERERLGLGTPQYLRVLPQYGATGCIWQHDPSGTVRRS